MLKKRIIPCLDIQNGRTVKGVNFIHIKDAGDPIELAKKYVNQGADELVFLDITASIEGRKTTIDLVRQIAEEIDIPFTVGGGIKSVEEVSNLIQAGADKISINTSAVDRPAFIREVAAHFGSQCVVVAIDVNIKNDRWEVFTHGGRQSTNILALDWAKQVEAFGAGEILLTVMANDGTKSGFSLSITDEIARAVNIPVIASGGAGTMADFEVLFKQTKASAGLAASIFHFGEISIPLLKDYLINEQIAIRR